MKKTILALVLLMVVAAPAFSYAAGLERPGDKMFKKLNLTDQQKEKVEALRLNHQKAMIDLKADLQKAKLAMRETLKKDEMSKADFTSQSDKVASVKEKIRKERESHMMAIYDVLDANQKKMWREFHANPKPRFEKRFKRNFKGRGLGPCCQGQGPGPNIDEDNN